jgi:hypothetical protein
VLRKEKFKKNYVNVEIRSNWGIDCFDVRCFVIASAVSAWLLESIVFLCFFVNTK